MSSFLLHQFLGYHADKHANGSENRTPATVVNMGIYRVPPLDVAYHLA